MPLYLDTRGRSTLGIGVCGRCGCKMSLDDLLDDPNAPGLKVCVDDLDQLDPYRLPPRETEDITLRYARPDLSLAPGPQEVPVGQLQAILDTGQGNAIIVNPAVPGNPWPGPMNVLAIAPPVATLYPSTTWTPGTQYQLGDQVTVSYPYGPAAADVDFFQYVCLSPGLSGTTPPTWPDAFGTTVTDYQVIWINQGIFLP